MAKGKTPDDDPAGPEAAAAAERAAAESEEFGTGGAATDGEPNGNGSTVSLEEHRRRGRSAADTPASEAETQEEDDGQFAFEVPEVGGKKVTLGTMIPRGTPVKYAYKMSGKSVPNVKGGLIDPSDQNGLLLVSYVVEDVDVKFTRDSDRKITGVTVYVVLAPRDVVNARTEAGRVMLLGEPGEAAGG